MDKVIREIDNDGYETEYVDHRDIVDKLDELVEESNDLRKAYHTEMNALGGMVSKLDKRVERIEKGRDDGKDTDKV